MDDLSQAPNWLILEILRECPSDAVLYRLALDEAQLRDLFVCYN